MNGNNTANKNRTAIALKRIFIGLFLFVLALYLVIWAFSPMVSRWIINDQLKTLPVKLSDHSSIRFNPFLLQITLNHVELIQQQTKHVYASIQFAEIDINTLELFSKRVLIENLIVKTLYLEASQSIDKLEVAGFSFNQVTKDEPVSDNTTKADSTTNTIETETPWVILSDNIVLSNIQLALKHLNHQHQLVINSLNLNQLNINEKNQQGKLDLKATINQAPLSLNVAFNQKGQMGQHQFNLALESFELNKISYLVAEHLETMSGVVNLNLQQSINIDQSGISLTQPALSFSLNALQLANAAFAIHSETFKVQLANTLVQLDKNQSPHISTDFSVENNALAIKNNDANDLLLSYKQLQLNHGKLQSDTVKNHTITLKTFNIENLLTSVKNTNNEKNSQPTPALADINKILLSDIQLLKQHVSLNTVEIFGLNTTVLLDKNKQLINLVDLSNNSQQNSTKKEETINNSEHQTDDINKTSQSTQAFTFSLNQLTVANDSQFTFNDASIQPAFSQHIQFNQINIGLIDSRAPEIKTPFTINLKTDAYAAAKISGAIQPFTKNTNLELNVQLKEFSLPQVSPYMEQALGFEMLSGQFDNDTKITIVENKIDGETALTMRGLELSSSNSTSNDSTSNNSTSNDSSQINSLKAQTAIPLNSALNMLKDDQGNLQLDIPLDGDVNSPEFGISSFIALITKKAIMSATETYLIDTFVPYANVLSVVRIAGEYMLKVRFEDLIYPPKIIDIQTEQADFIQQFSTLLKDKQETQVKVCSIATTADLPNTTANLKDPQYIEKLKQISQQRGEKFKAWVVQQGQIESSRLLLCKPQIDDAKDAKPRIEFEA